jgi:copper chaperone
MICFAYPDTPRLYPRSLAVSHITALPTPSRRYAVAGMTCGHCVMSVTEEVAEIAGVTAVDVDLASGQVTVAGEHFSDEAVASAVAEAGYEVIA